MKKALYIGIYTNGSTSKMRADTLKALLPQWSFKVIDTDVPFNRQNRIFRSVGFRYKIGPVISAVNDYVRRNLGNDVYDLVWTDKAIFISGDTTKQIKSQAHKLAHFTPDTAFMTNRSKHFYNSIPYYDFLITTKSFELDYYYKTIGREKTILSHQGYASAIHQPHFPFDEKKFQVAFVGLCEAHREQMVGHLIENEIDVVVGGRQWERFIERHKGNKFLHFKGLEVRDHAYAELISSSCFGLGLLSKNFPELHTTRTFEIPACGTALATEKNGEIAGFFTDDEVVYYKDAVDLVNKIKYFRSHMDELEKITANGLRKVRESGKSYEALMQSCLDRILQ